MKIKFVTWWPISIVKPVWNERRHILDLFWPQFTNFKTRKKDWSTFGGNCHIKFIEICVKEDGWIHIQRTISIRDSNIAELLTTCKFVQTGLVLSHRTGNGKRISGYLYNSRAVDLWCVVHYRLRHFLLDLSNMYNNHSSTISLFLVKNCVKYFDRENWSRINQKT